jgi:predicted Zn-ribbon and HTH transcriptional regulator
MASMAEDILSSQVADTNDSLLDDEMSMLDEHTKEAKIMRGLGKIAASLKSKGEGFAADVVEATALSIQEDFKKEASKRDMVQKELQKLARNMRISGKAFGADLVESSIKKIKNS